jgi:hypothetical protein
MSKELKIPGIGRLGFKSPIFHEKAGYGVGRKDIVANGVPIGHLSVEVFDKDGKPKAAKQVMSRWGRLWGNIRGNDLKINLGSGLVTNVGVLAMANEYAWANPLGVANTILGLSNYHASGTGTTAAAATDIKLTTWDSIAAVAGIQSLVSAANTQSYKTVATIAYSGSEAVTEWGLHTSSAIGGVTTGSPFTATSATSFTATGTPYTASSSTVAGQQFQVAVAGTTTVWGLILGNTSSVATIPAWYTVAAGTAGSTPGSTETFTLRPALWDHKQFAAINVVAGDSIQFTYTVTINSGG